MGWSATAEVSASSCKLGSAVLGFVRENGTGAAASMPCIVLTGEISDASPPLVWGLVAQAFGLSEEDFQTQILQHAPLVVQRGLDQMGAVNYAARLRSLGAKVAILYDDPELWEVDREGRKLGPLPAKEAKQFLLKGDRYRTCGTEEWTIWRDRGNADVAPLGLEGFEGTQPVAENSKGGVPSESTSEEPIPAPPWLVEDNKGGDLPRPSVPTRDLGSPRTKGPLSSEPTDRLTPAQLDSANKRALIVAIGIFVVLLVCMGLIWWAAAPTTSGSPTAISLSATPYSKPIASTSSIKPASMDHGAVYKFTEPNGTVEYSNIASHVREADAKVLFAYTKVPNASPIAAKHGAFRSTQAGAVASLHEVDFSNFTYPASWCSSKVPGLPKNITVKDGKYDGPPNTHDFFSVGKVLFGNLPGDGEEEAIVHAMCADAGWNYMLENVFVFDLRNGHAELAAYLNQDQIEADYKRYHPDGVLWQTVDPLHTGGLRISGHNLLIDWEADGAHCCAEHIVTLQYLQNGHAMILHEAPVIRNIPQSPSTGRSATSEIQHFPANARPASTAVTHDQGAQIKYFTKY